MTGGLKAAPEGLLAVVAVLGEITFLQRLRGPLSGAAPLFYAGLTVSSSMGASMRRGPQKVMWIAGGAGRAARAIERQIDRERFVVITTDTELDVTDREAVQQYASINRPDIVVNCAAMADEAACAAHPVEAYRVNTLGARNLAAASWAVGAMMVQLSVDDVFADGDGARNEFDELPSRDNPCAKSKIAGEQFVRTLNPRHVIVRSNWVYSAEPGSWLADLIMAARTGTPFPVAENWCSSPTSATTLAACVIALIESGECGVFHGADQGVVSRADFAREVLRLAGLPADCLRPTSDPADRRTVHLDDLMLTLTGVFSMPPWQEDLRTYLGSQGLLASA